jgi:hypothetical protein
MTLVLTSLRVPVHVPLHVPTHLPRGVLDFLPGTVLAALAAVLFALGSVLQHQACEAAAADGGGVRFAVMVRRRTWLVGQLSTVTGSGVQVAALALAPVSIVQPLLSASLVVALGVRTARARCWPTRTEVVGALLTAGGLAVFLVAARPAPGVPERLPHPAAVLSAVVLGVAVVAAASRTRRGPSAALACGVTAGVAAGIAAVLIAAALKTLSERGLVAALGSPALWAALVMAVCAQVGAQQAYSRGALTWSLPALTVLDPLSAVPAARVLLGERLAPGHAGVWVPAGVVAALGIVFLARAGQGCRHPIGRSYTPQLSPDTVAG